MNQTTLESESESHLVESNSLGSHQLYSPWNSPGQNTGLGSLSLLQGIFLTQGLNSVSHIAGILYQLCPKGSPGILERVAYPSPGYLPDPGIEPGYPALQAFLYQLSYKGSPISLLISVSLSFHSTDLASPLVWCWPVVGAKYTVRTQVLEKQGNKSINTIIITVWVFLK